MSSFWSRFSAEDRVQYFAVIAKVKDHINQSVAENHWQGSELSYFRKTSELIDSILAAEEVLPTHAADASAELEPQVNSALTTSHTSESLALNGTKMLCNTFMFIVKKIGQAFSEEDASTQPSQVLETLSNVIIIYEQHASRRGQQEQLSNAIRQEHTDYLTRLNRTSAAIEADVMKAEEDYHSSMDALTITALSASLLGVVLLIVGLVLANAIVAVVGLGMAVAGGIAFFSLNSQCQAVETSLSNDSAQVNEQFLIQ